jgi:hypothetical protein
MLAININDHRQGEDNPMQDRNPMHRPTDPINPTVGRWIEQVGRVRDEAIPDFPQSPAEDSLLFAFTELGEALDAQLRQRPAYLRNHQREHVLGGELAQTLHMLACTVRAVGRRDYTELEPAERHGLVYTALALRHMTEALDILLLRLYPATWDEAEVCAHLERSMMAVAAIARTAGLNPEVELEREHRRMVLRQESRRRKKGA